LLPNDRMRYRIRFIGEEFGEVLSACSKDTEVLELRDRIRVVIDRMKLDVDFVNLVHEQADLDFVNEGLRLEMGVKGEPVEEEVFQANMRKRWPDGTFHRTTEGKVLKPDGWKPANVRDVMLKQGWNLP
jgi:predicted HAD superfamily Cof-like phosphohydrolase